MVHDEPETSMTSLQSSDVEQRSAPPLVYSAAGSEQWVVEPPPDATCSENRIFAGPQAQQQALTYAHEKFGNARFFPYREE